MTDAMPDAAVAIAAAEAGAAVIRARYGSPGDRTAKLGIDFVTETDLEAEQAILDVVRAARPDDAFLGEEAGLLGDATAERTWLVDPLCGTLNFAARTPLVAVNVALRIGADLSAAAVAEPFAHEVSWTDGSVAHLRRDGVDEPLTPSALTRLVDIDLNNDPVLGRRLRGAGVRRRLPRARRVHKPRRHLGGVRSSVGLRLRLRRARQRPLCGADRRLSRSGLRSHRTGRSALGVGLTRSAGRGRPADPRELRRAISSR